MDFPAKMRERLVRQGKRAPRRFIGVICRCFFNHRFDGRCDSMAYDELAGSTRIFTGWVNGLSSLQDRFDRTVERDRKKHRKFFINNCHLDEDDQIFFRIPCKWYSGRGYNKKYHN